eukprot:1515015-Pleurochrysis_carterae.AAC.1
MPCMLVCEGALGGVEERRLGASHGAAQHTPVTFVYIWGINTSFEEMAFWRGQDGVGIGGVGSRQLMSV